MMGVWLLENQLWSNLSALLETVKYFVIMHAHMCSFGGRIVTLLKYGVFPIIAPPPMKL